MNALRRLRLILPALLFASCSMPDFLASATLYKIQLKDGSEVICRGAPQYQKKTGYYRYRTLQKRDALIRADEVVKIMGQDA